MHERAASREACPSQSGSRRPQGITQTIYDWINGRRVERLIDALRLSRASGVAIENLAGEMLKSSPPPFKYHA